MADQCKHCSLRGDLKACLATECSKHEDWYAVEQQKRINKLEERIEVQSLVIEKLERQIHYEPRF